MKHKRSMTLEISDDDEDVAYLMLPDHPGDQHGVVKKTINLRSAIGAYSGPDINLDFDSDNVLIGIEILA